MRAFDRPGRSPVIATEGIAATSHPLATQTAMTVLRDGGNALDAAIAASATLCVVEPHMTGFGGDCFAIVAEPDGSLHGLNGSGRSAAKADAGWLRGEGFETIPPTSVHAVTAPGAVHAWETLHRRFGVMDFVRLFADAARYAREGFPVHERVARDWALQLGKLRGDEGARRHLLFDGEAPAMGRRIRFPALAEVIDAVASGGADAFYRGAIAADIARTVKARGGFLDEADLDAVRSEWVDLISIDHCGHRIHEIPPNGQGVTALILLRLLERIGRDDRPDSGARYYQEIELARLAYGVRDRYVADPGHLALAPEVLFGDAAIDHLAAQYSPDRRNGAIRTEIPRPADTIYLCVVDRDLRCVSFINSTYSGFGTGIVTGRTGIALQNRGSCFTLEEGHPNCIGPSKRPLHTIIPGMATRDGRPAICFGVMGGSYQPLGHAHVLSNMLHYGMNPQSAIDSPRIFWDDNGVLALESGIPAAVAEHLGRRGFETGPGGPHGGGQIIRIDHAAGVMMAGSDPRKDGHAAGF